MITMIAHTRDDNDDNDDNDDDDDDDAAHTNTHKYIIYAKNEASMRHEA